LGWKIACTRSPKLSITAREPSLDPSSTTMTSICGQSRSRALSMARATKRT
jgi:hypothetical protein